jgi:hypothetical protein
MLRAGATIPAGIVKVFGDRWQTERAGLAAQKEAT